MPSQIQDGPLVPHHRRPAYESDTTATKAPATLEEAKAQLRENWHQWLAWAKLAELREDT